MFSEFVLINRKASQDETLQLQDLLGDWLYWRTCVRQVAFGTISWLAQAHEKGQILPSDQIFVGGEAYRYCLEVICGLHSPMLGETEVGGQFKKEFSQKNFSCEQKALGFAKYFQSIFTDFKEVRAQFLTNLGSSSYGSLTRKYLLDFKAVHIFGAGQLSKEMLPWLCKNRQKVVVHARRLAQAQELLKEFPQFSNLQSRRLVLRATDFSESLYESSLSGAALIIAAPIPSQEIQQWLQCHQDEFKLIIDLRANAHEDLIMTQLQVIRLDQLFAQIEQVQQEVLTKIQSAKTFIQEISATRVLVADHRPFGWDDLCV